MRKNGLFNKKVGLCCFFVGFVYLVFPAYGETSLMRSNKIATEFTHELAALLPEKASDIGFTEYDSQGSRFSQEHDQQLLDFYKLWQVKLSHFVDEADDDDLKIDLRILTDYVRHQHDYIILRDKEKVVPFIPGSQKVFESLRPLINHQTTLARKKAGVKRFRFYVRSGFLQGIQRYTAAVMEKYGEVEAFYPHQEQVNYYLANSAFYLDAVQQLLSSTGDKSWEDDFVEYKKQVKQFDTFIEQHVLPKTSKQASMSKVLYQQMLASRGVTKPDTALMIMTGKRDYEALFKTYQALAQKIASYYHLEDSAPKTIIDFFKQKKITSPEKVKALYQKASSEIEEIIEEHQIVSLPDGPLRIRLSTPAESKILPVLHLYMPPRVNHANMLPEFVVPTNVDGLPYDDFTYHAVSIALAAHEGRPGHDLHMRRVLEPDVSLIRAAYAENPVNHEGWALYAEDLIYPYVGMEAQFSILQMRLLRIARYFLDPLVQDNKADESDVVRLLHDGLGISKAFAKLEYQRYAYRQPAQAATYYQGLLNIRALKKKLQNEFGELSLKCFHDTLLSFGLMPTEYVWALKARFKICAVSPFH